MSAKRRMMVSLCEEEASRKGRHRLPLSNYRSPFTVIRLPFTVYRLSHRMMNKVLTHGPRS